MVRIVVLFILGCNLGTIWASTKYAHVIESMGPCTGPDYADVEVPLTNVKLTKLNRTAKTISFDFDFPVPIDDNIYVSIKIEKLNGASKEVTFIPQINNPCPFFLKMYPKYYILIMSNIGVKQPDKCPIPAGHYSLKNFVFNIADSGYNNFPMKGKFRIRTIFGERKTKKIITCVETLSDHYAE
ncbi:unnamed protein product [Phyllotreta striolata]|uniref:MD-2-related lipid-recognition domain-containing protein n=1 Tax=Phyllotreta striolata TaxID=444603 RepID=A0A9N9TJ99_PHYSR|nr:unnamed protein product [Phyllotreta striolata]